MSLVENKAIVQRLIEEVYNEGNLDVVDELVAPDIFNHPAVPEHQHGIDGFKHVIEWVREISSDVHYEIDDIIAEGEKVAVRMTQSGTQTGSIRDTPPLAKGLGRLRPLVPSRERKGRRAMGREGRSEPTTAT